MGLLQTVISGQKPRSNHAHIVDALGRDIISGAFPSGSTLPGDSELMARFGVSRTVLREAMKTLAAKGLVVPRAGIGTRVTSRDSWSLFDPSILSWHFDCGIDEAFLVHLSEIRLAFEPSAAALAAERATPADILRLEQLAAAMDDDAHTPETFAVADLRFHLAVAEAAANPFMRSVGSLIEAALVGVFKLSSPADDGKLAYNASASHMAIVDAIRGRDVAAARSAMETVIIVGLERVRAALRSAGQDARL